MSSETSLTGCERLHNIVVSLGMEITDSILFALRNQVIACRQEQKEQLVLVDPILIGIDTVGRHIDEIRVLSDARAFSLLNELVQAYQLITEELAGQQEACQALVSESLTKVFDWQHSCVRDGVGNLQEAGATGERITPVDLEGKTEDLLATVQQEIAATGMMAVRESAALLELVHVQNEAQNATEGLVSEGLEESEDVGKEASGNEREEFSSLIQGNISSLQQVFHQEMERLRCEIVQD